jgi:hypothetical protein
MQAWLKEPLLHFVMAGALLFSAYASLKEESRTLSRTARITTAKLNWLQENWVRPWQRPPTEVKLGGRGAQIAQRFAAFASPIMKPAR